MSAPAVGGNPIAAPVPDVRRCIRGCGPLTYDKRAGLWRAAAPGDCDEPHSHFPAWRRRCNAEAVRHAARIPVRGDRGRWSDHRTDER